MCLIALSGKSKDTRITAKYGGISGMKLFSTKITPFTYKSGSGSYFNDLRQGQVKYV